MLRNTTLAASKALSRPTIRSSSSILKRGVATTASTSSTPSSSTSTQQQQSRNASTRAISNPTLANIEKRWESMDPQEQAELWMALRDRMKVNWTELTLQEKKASYWIAFGPHGPRALDPPGETARVFGATLIGVAVGSVLMLLIHSRAKPPPQSMSKEWQEASNEYLKSQNADPITGLASPDYEGQGMVQDPDGHSHAYHSGSHK